MELKRFAPNFEGLELSEREKYLLKPFFTNLDQSVFAVNFLPPEVIGALCSRASRAKEDLRIIFLKEFINPFLEEESEYSKSLRAMIDFLHKYPTELIFSNPKGREFYIKWLSQFGDDSIAQMSGVHLVYPALSQIAIKQIEDMRVGIAPIEKSTRYVDYSSKVNGRYRYYTDPNLEEMGLMTDYRRAMDRLFETYTQLLEEYMEHLRKQYPGEEDKLLKTKAFDTVRLILPVATLSQLSLFGNGQAFEYMLNRCLEHSLGEVRWLGQRAFEELDKIISGFLRRINSPESKRYRRYLSERGKRIREALGCVGWSEEPVVSQSPYVKLIWHEPDGENKIIAGLIYKELKEPFDNVVNRVGGLSVFDKERILQKVLKDREERYYKIPRAFEYANLKFEILMNIGAWRDLHRHRMHTQDRQLFHIYHGFDVPEGLKEAGLDGEFAGAVSQAEEIFRRIEEISPEIAQYCCSLAHRVRFVQAQNMRAFFWEAELRTIPQGHPDYRRIEQKKIRLVQNIYPLISKYLLIDMEDYDFARRGSSEQIKNKEEELRQHFEQK